MTAPGWRIAACLTFGVASATDFVDGWIARRCELVTSFGKVADPIADKALTGTALVLLSAYDAAALVGDRVILVREWGVTLLRFWVIRYGVIAGQPGRQGQDGAADPGDRLVPVAGPGRARRRSARGSWARRWW